MSNAPSAPDSFDEFLAELHRVCPEAVYTSAPNMPARSKASLARLIDLLRPLPDNAGIDALLEVFRAAAPTADRDERRSMDEVRKLAMKDRQNSQGLGWRRISRVVGAVARRVMKWRERPDRAD